jgi:hypothetical protein
MLEEKLKEAIVAELKRQAVNNPQSLSVDNADDLVVKGKIDLDDLAMVIAGAVAGGPQRLLQGLPSANGLNQERRLPPDVFPKMAGRRHDGTAAAADRKFD